MSNKPFKTIEQQIELLVKRGLIINNDTAHYLQHLNYYRLSGYWIPFQEDLKTHNFKKGTTFSSVLNLYIFDRELRLLLLDVIERIEVSVRTQWAYHFAEDYGPEAYFNCELSKNRYWHAQNLIILKKDIERSDELFIKHFLPDNPPIWAICEIISFGLLSKWLKDLKPSKTRNKIGKIYNLDYSVLISFIEHLAYLRNLCAHHNRVWNRRMTKTLTIPISKPHNLICNFEQESSNNIMKEASRKIYNTLVMIIYFLSIISPNNHFKNKLIDLITEHSIDVKMMGFPIDWKSRPIWKI
ncbi:AbiD phage protein-like [Legionella beliardensis]|uniref:AbiD phage protein-like n=1 Tax=Legionella beliardensis TaxID=91822 RepID=A0A378I470_9GAMM|nr:Abi family protein [Legionella beliardensis]STX29793.1 AbiD phage protein-like [Legionella beliardensis]